MKPNTYYVVTNFWSDRSGDIGHSVQIYRGKTKASQDMAKAAAEYREEHDEIEFKERKPNKIEYHVDGDGTWSVWYLDEKTPN